MNKRFVKIAVSLILVVLMLQFIDLQGLGRTLLTIPLSITISVVIGYLLGQVLSAFKWWLIARSSGIKTTYGYALRTYFIGMFTNCFGFGIVGGDLARALLLARGQNQKASAIASVFADRAHGLGTLALIGVMAAILVGSSAAGFQLTVLLIGVGVLIVLGWIYGPKLLLILSRKTGKLEKLSAEIERAFPRKPSLVISITLISICFHSSHVLLHWLLGMGFGVDIPLGYLFFAIPFVNILSSLPISWNGLGVRENAYIFFLAPAILSAEQAAAIGAIWLLSVTISAAIGGIFAFLAHDFERLKEIEAKDSQPSIMAGGSA
jgi:uncharacterized protein (TIRG00374 family)